MSKFSELLKRPLPSAMNNINEGIDYEGCGGSCRESDFGAPAPLEDLSASTTPVFPSNNINNDVVIPNTPINTPADEPSAQLTPDESIKADDTINAVATPLLIKDELNDDEIKEFVESVDLDIAVNEGFLTERTIIKFDKNAKRAQLYEVAVAACAREHKDPLFKKLETVYAMERRIKAKLRQKYNAEATRKVKEYLARAKKSKSGILARIAKKITGK